MGGGSGSNPASQTRHKAMCWGVHRVHGGDGRHTGGCLQARQASRRVTAWHVSPARQLRPQFAHPVPFTCVPSSRVRNCACVDRAVGLAAFLPPAAVPVAPAADFFFLSRLGAAAPDFEGAIVMCCCCCCCCYWYWVWE